MESRYSGILKGISDESLMVFGLEKILNSISNEAGAWIDYSRIATPHEKGKGADIETKYSLVKGDRTLITVEINGGYWTSSDDVFDWQIAPEVSVMLSDPSMVKQYNDIRGFLEIFS